MSLLDIDRGGPWGASGIFGAGGRFIELFDQHYGLIDDLHSVTDVVVN
jgi:hypothetical protein